jgi:hypothetical protein
MSVFNDFRKLSVDLFSAFEAPQATLTRTVTGVRTKADRSAGTKGTDTVTTISVRAFVGKRRVRAEDGTITTQTTARLDGEAKEGDKLTIGSMSYTVGAVEEVNPDGMGAMVYIAVLR